MARPRLPQAVAAASGSAIKNPSRFKGRKPPRSAPLGDPPEWLSDDERKAWLIFANELPWLERADRTTLELASRIAAEMRTSYAALTGAKIGHLRACLTEMGATPAARSKVQAGGEGDDDDDPAARYLS